MFAHSESSTSESLNWLPGAIWRRMRRWNRRRRIGGCGDSEDEETEQPRDKRRRRRAATVYDLSGTESGDEIAMKERNEEDISETLWTRRNGPVEINLMNSRCRSWNSANTQPPAPPPPSGLLYGDYQNPHKGLEKSAGGNSSRADTSASEHSIIGHRSDPAMDTARCQRTCSPESPNAQGDDDEHNQKETEEEPKEFLAPQPEQWRAFAPASRACRPTFVFDPAGKFSYYWSMVVSLAFLYNLWVIAYRFSFDEITSATRFRWFCSDYACDFIYLLDIAVQFRTGFLEDGVLQTNPSRLRGHYMNSTKFYMDCLSLLPLDFLYLSLGYRSILRCFRLTKVYKWYAFVEKTERHTNFPNVLRGVLLLHAVLLIFHWNACLVYALRGYLTFSHQFWDVEDKFYNYLNAYYLSCRTLIMVDTLPRPRDKSKVGMAFIIGESVVALAIFAGVLGHVAGIVSNISAARKQFQAQLDSVKTYMRIRKVPRHLQRKVVRWFDYWWSTKKYGNDGAVMECLPDKLKAEIAIHVHLDTLKRVEIFRNTEPGFLCELVLKLRPMLFSPGDYVCRKGEVGNEMYIVSIGRLHVLADDGRTVLATLKAGSYFGEISILNMGTEGNRRTASVVSVGYSDLFCLSKRDIWDVLKDYPSARNRLELIAQKRLHQKLAHKAAMTAMATALNRKVLTPRLSDSSQRRESAPATIHLSTAPDSGESSPSHAKGGNPFLSAPGVSDYTRTGAQNTTAPMSYHRLGPAAAFSHCANSMKRTPAALSSNSDEASALCDIDDTDEQTLAKLERTQLLLQTTTLHSPGFGGQFANDALILSPDGIDAPPFIDDITVTIGAPLSAGPATGTERKSRYSNESQTVL